MRIYVAACFFLVNSFVMPAAAWWDNEHHAVVIIAENHLSNQARKQIKKLLGDASLAERSLWPDRIKSQKQWAHSKTWHYVNIDNDRSFVAYQPVARGDVLWALEHFYGELIKPQLSAHERRQALLFFAHFVADIHQPLHVGSGEDRGGNAVSVLWFDRPKVQNLHQVWDGLLTYNDLTPVQYAQFLDRVPESLRRDWQNSTFKDWAIESQQLLEQVYSFGVENASRKVLELGDEYLRANKSIAERRLAQAGVRLAYYLNKAFAELDK